MTICCYVTHLADIYYHDNTQLQNMESVKVAVTFNDKSLDKLTYRIKLIENGRVLPVFWEVEARYATALNRAITRDSRTTFVVSALKG